MRFHRRIPCVRLILARESGKIFLYFGALGGAIVKIEKNERLVLIGDSVTDCGRARPIGERGGLGSGYPALLNAMLSSRHPELAIRVTNMGVSGNTVRDLKARWQSDVLDLQPAWVSVMIGINDVWRQFDCPLQPETHVLPEEYHATLEALVRQTMPHVKGLLLVTPVYMDTNRQDPMRARRDEYAAIVRDIAARTGAALADPQPAFDRHFSHCHPMSMSWDYVHPDLTGHMMIADAIYQALEA